MHLERYFSLEDRGKGKKNVKGENAFALKQIKGKNHPLVEQSKMHSGRE